MPSGLARGVDLTDPVIVLGYVALLLAIVLAQVLPKLISALLWRRNGRDRRRRSSDGDQAGCIDSLKGAVDQLTEKIGDVGETIHGLRDRLDKLELNAEFEKRFGRLHARLERLEGKD